ncbi:ATP-binding protein [Amycolatopsis sp. NPDC054798]
MTARATFGAELRRLRASAGLSLTELAERVHYSKGYLSKVETGLAAPNSALAALCESEFGTPGALAALVPAETGKRRTRPDLRPSGLPPVTADFTGRDAESEAVRQILASDGGVCVISGMGGAGKTALAVRCAYRLEASFADGSLFLDLRGTSDDPVAPADAHDRLLRILEVPAERIPADPDDRAALFRTCLRGRSFLLVLDNAGSTGQVRPLLPAEPKCRVVITSRSRLPALDEASHLSLGVLPPGSAAELVAALTGAPPDAALRIAGRCGCLPLAIRIAAARLRAHPAWDVAELERRLTGETRRLGELDDGERSLAAAFRLSVRQLDPPETRLFGLLALHPGPDFDVTAAQALGSLDSSTAERLLDRLHQAYLITQPQLGRYSFHDLVRVFAASGTPDQDAFDRLADFSVAAAERADRAMSGPRYRPEVTYPPGLPKAEFPDQESAIAWFRAEWPNLVALCRRAGESERCWQLAFFLCGFFHLAKLWDPWIATHRWARAAAEAVGNRWAAATTTANLGIAHADRGDLDEASRCFRQALQEYRDLGDRHGEATALAHSAWAEHYRGNHEQALRELRSAADFYALTGNRRSGAITARGVALVLTALGRPGEAARLVEETLAVFGELGLELDVVMGLNCLGWARFRAGDHSGAEAAYREAAVRAEACGSTHEAARACLGLGNVAAARGAAREAASQWERAEAAHPGLDPVTVGEAAVRAEFQ